MALLRTHANLGADKGVDPDLLLQCIKDASDNSNFGLTVLSIDDGDPELPDTPTGDALRALLENKAAWGSKPDTRKKHRMRRAIDRRFCGSPGRRTRDYHLRDDDGFGWGW